ncbi:MULTISPECIES: type IV pilus biogenesis protein PilM [unclassified Pseudomonas]|uniref:type IV pilus biogenesis protein PilM n=2 Tax=Pseudomonas TaxID=286 RepID=UPI002B2287B1|nr:MULTISPECIES: type IV pilus biogenesis protein PilM [unclassified Pseudomonas]MEA9979917.1 type IV pilus biogenesis protein PilM [Pseudomonas sp. RTS4]MEA9996496.1 type IV pilus biogenesis protein PilM [Pseudomonas sp. AA4]MEB0198166.1 type IV pilus biogenesis protein PilM [Pseudomonas sp. 5S4]MEB0247845.1 type IV pilus biogenesis protein PilM [Pseudomonas sp. 10S5]
MPLLWVLILVTLSITFMFNSEQAIQDRNASVTDVTVASESMLVYRNAVAKYSYSNPAFVGRVPDALLSFPSWYIKSPNLSNYISGGTSYSFYVGSLPGLAGELAHQTGSINVGTNQNGVLLAPNIANSGIVLPAQIPLGSVVLIQ